MSHDVTSLIKVDHLVKHFSVKTRMGSISAVKAVDNISFHISEGETVGLVGESGSGKSTTGRLMLRLLEPTSGSTRYAGADVYSLKGTALRDFRKSAQIVFQDPYGAFDPRMTVGRILGEALDLKGVKGRVERNLEVDRLLQVVKLPTYYKHRFPHEFSGGQRQRIGIARAIAVEPKFIVADEPVSALDVSTQAEIINLFLELQATLNLTMLFISHDLSVVRVLADRTIVLFSGKIMEMAKTTDLFDAPLHPYTQELLAAIPTPNPDSANRNRKRTKHSHYNDEETDQPNTGCPYAGRCGQTMDICWTTMPDLKHYSTGIGVGAIHSTACHWAENNAATNIDKKGDFSTGHTAYGDAIGEV